MQLLVGYGRTIMPCGGLSGTSSILPGTYMSSSLFCFPKHERSNLTLWIHSSAHLAFELTMRTILHDVDDSRLQAHVGGPKGDTTVLTFAISHPEAALDRIHLIVESLRPSENESLETIHAWVFHETSDWIRDLIDFGGCVNPGETIKRIRGMLTDPRAKNYPPPAMHISFRSSTDVTLSAHSRPARQVGRWFVLILCDSGVDGHSCGMRRASLTTSTMSYPDRTWMLTKATLFMLLMPILILASVDLLYCLVYHVLLKNATRGHPFSFLGRPSPLFFRFGSRRRSGARGGGGLFWRRLLNVFEPQPFFAPLLFLMVGTFFATSMQLALGDFLEMSQTGDRDTCFYNEKCYWPDPIFNTNVPMNHMISHIPYFIAGLHVALQAMLAEDRVRWKLRQVRRRATSSDVSPGGLEDDGTAVSVMASEAHGGLLEAALDLRPFYAIAAGLAAEGIGSMSYHLCPSLSVFQFDTAFMIPIFHLCTTALTDWSAEELKNRSATIALKYFLFMMVPVWIFNFLGTWFDVGLWTIEGDPLIYKVFGASLTIWVLFAVQGLDIFFKTGDVSSRRRLVLKALVVLTVFACVIFPEVRAAFGGTANTFILLSVVVMAAVVGWQVVVRELSYQRLRWHSWRVVPDSLFLFVKYPHVFLMLVIGTLSLACFQEKVVKVDTASTAADSHDSNQPCVLVGVLDLHDVWHFLSAIALALFAMTLLDVKVHDFARKHKLIVWNEVTGETDDELSLSDYESSE